MKARISEIFSSIQGEGIYAGHRQIFVRFAGCNIDCAFCDTKNPPGTRLFSAKQLLNHIKRINASGGHHSVSITGGEPLLQAEFLKEALGGIRDMGLKVYLETNGTLPDQLDEVLEFVDIIAMDIKLPTSTKSSGYWQEHEQFLKKAAAKELFIKTVVTSDTTPGDFVRALDLVKSENKDIAFIIQPVTAVNGTKAIDIIKLLRYHKQAVQSLPNARIIPQLHKAIGVR